MQNDILEMEKQLRRLRSLSGEYGMRGDSQMQRQYAREAYALDCKIKRLEAEM
jgi:hypothetical protein